MTKDKKSRRIALDPNPKGCRKALGGAEHDDWNDWLATVTSLALPVSQKNSDEAADAATAAFSGMVDLRPADPIEGILISQLMVAYQASLSMYRRAWAQPAEYFEARMKYLALADKAARTALMFTERLDQHRGRGQQQITVEHVTVNADQAVVTDQVVSGRSKEDVATNLLMTGTDKAMEIIESKSAVAMPVAGGSKGK